MDEIHAKWFAAGRPTKGMTARRWSKRRMEFFKALHAENLEYERTLAYHGFDPEDDASIANFLTEYRNNSAS
jgi:hypothetical protein